ncbi:MAG TPA: APC family permease [Rhizomicrobium sp.]|jgi:APA family basic amino acid/polyamine antiporter|nr:APC family permease [Rhizomicrobium sp.]
MSVSTASVSRNHLLHILGLAFSVAVALGSMIGSGIMGAPARIAGDIDSTLVILAIWVVGAVHASLAANVYAELGTSVPQAGGPYVFTHRAMGDVPGLVVGWGTWAATVAGTAANSIVFADALGKLAPAMAPHTAGIAVALQVILYGTNILGLREGRALQEVTSFAKAALLFVMAALAVFLVPPPASASMPDLGTALTWAGIINGYHLVRGAYAGWDAPVYFSEENVVPGKSVARGIFIGLAMTAVLYILVNASLLHALGPTTLSASKVPFADALSGPLGGTAVTLVSLATMVIVLSCTNANIMIAPRTLFALSRDRLLPHQIAAVNAGGSPHWAYVISGVASIALAATGQFRLVFGLIGTLDTLTGLLTEISFFILRRREPDLPRPYRAVGYPVLPALAVVIDASLMVLFNYADYQGAIAAAVMIVLCVPFAWIARRARQASA